MAHNDGDNGEFRRDWILVRTNPNTLKRIDEDYGFGTMLDLVNQISSLFSSVATGVQNAVTRVGSELVNIAQANVVQPMKRIFQQLRDFGVDAIQRILNDLAALADADWSVDGLTRVWNDLRNSANLGLRAAFNRIREIGGALRQIASNGIANAVRFCKDLFRKLLTFSSDELLAIVGRLADIAIGNGAALLAEVERTLGRLTRQEIDAIAALWRQIDAKVVDFGNAIVTLRREPESKWLDDPTKFPGDIWHYVDTSQATGGPAIPTASIQGGTAAVSPENVASFLYLDVGKWGGSRRDFGVVCGATAVLCELQTDADKFRHRDPAPAAPNPPPLPVPTGNASMGQAPEELRQINRVLNGLNTAVNGEPGGTRNVSIIRWMRAKTPIPNDNVFYDGTHQLPPVFVFLGDMHIPIVTSTPNSYHLPQVPHAWYDVAGAAGNVMRSFECEDSHHRLFVLDYLPTKQGDLAWWYGNYSATDGFKRDAAHDLTAFVMRLTAVRDQMMTDHDTPPPELVQLGDMIDLWIGVWRQWVGRDESTRRRGQPMDGILAQSYPDRATLLNGLDVANHWGGHAISGAHAYSPAIMAANNYEPSKWLWGNHDNYFGMNAPGALKTRHMQYYRTGHFLAEHGHRWDGFNADGATNGNLVTQFLMIGKTNQRISVDRTVMTFGPDLVRWAEPASRLRQLRDASWLFRKNVAAGTPFCVYVMGHTHDPGLAEFHVKPFIGNGPTVAGRYDWGVMRWNQLGRPA